VWKLAREPRQRLPLEVAETPPMFEELDDFETVVWDYRAADHSARDHPLAPMRAALRQQGLPDARGVATKENGATVRYAGLVISRQRPGTAGGVVFVTLEDETGFVNLVVWERVCERHALILKTAPFLGVTGRVQRQDGVLHVIAHELWVPDVARAPVTGGSRDFR